MKCQVLTGLSHCIYLKVKKDAIRSPLQGISFSAGATSIPKNIDALYDFNEVVIIYDNDEAGEQGAKKVAERIKSESPTTKVLIAQWDSSLPKGYDVYDDYDTGFEKVDEAIVNAMEYETGPLEGEYFRRTKRI